MKIKVECASITEISCDLLVVNEFEGVKHPGGATGAVDQALGGLIKELIDAGEIDGKLGKVSVIHTQGKLPAKRVAVAGLGKSSDFNLDKVREAGASAIAAAKKIKARKVVTIVHGAGVGGLEAKDAAQALTEGSIIGEYKFEGYASKREEPEHKIDELVIVDYVPKKIKEIEEGARVGEIIASSVNKARDLVNAPGNKMTPTELAKYAEATAREAGLECSVMDISEAKKMGMDALWSVAKGSDEPAKVIVIKYNGSESDKDLIGLIGKGITFDAGGISLKPSKRLGEMKDDMSGAAAVIEVMRAISKLKSKKKVVAVIPATENMPDGKATRPGDIVGSLSGKTIEIINTDAEGRVILADAVTYAKKLGATKLIDIATLTGGCVTALGDVASGIMGNEQKLVDELIEAGKAAGEKMWQLPLYEEYKEYLKSELADIKNSMENGMASPSTGATFIQKFVEDTPWAHIDIAGTAYLHKGRGYLSEGATGVGVRTLIYYLLK